VKVEEEAEEEEEEENQKCRHLLHLRCRCRGRWRRHHFPYLGCWSSDYLSHPAARVSDCQTRSFVGGSDCQSHLMAGSGQLAALMEPLQFGERVDNLNLTKGITYYSKVLL
jgi:hypothetical protein